MSDILSIILNDHLTVKHLIEQWKSTHVTSKKEHLANAIAKEVVQHGFAEEKVFYPLLERFFTLGAAEAKNRALVNEHMHAEILFAEALEHPADSKEFITLFERAVDDVLKHIKEEEDTVIPQVSAKIPVGDLIEAGSRFNLVKQHAPAEPREFDIGRK